MLGRKRRDLIGLAASKSRQLRCGNDGQNESLEANRFSHFLQVKFDASFVVIGDVWFCFEEGHGAFEVRVWVEFERQLSEKFDSASTATTVTESKSKVRLFKIFFEVLGPRLRFERLEIAILLGGKQQIRAVFTDSVIEG